MNTPVLQIALFHRYYDNNIWQHLLVCPDDNTQKVLNHYRLLPCQSQGVFALYYFGLGKQSDLMAALPELTDNQMLTFNMHSENVYWDVISDLPVNQAGQLFYSSTLIETDRTNPISTAQGQQLKMQYQPRQVHQCDVIGQIQISTASLTNRNDNRFYIQMNSRSTHWHYYIINRSGRRFNRLAIGNGEGLVFNDQGLVTLQNGEAARLFDLNQQPLAMQQTLDDPFNLVDLTDDSHNGDIGNDLVGQTVLGALPIPAIDTFGLDRHKGMISSMYVYI